MVNLQPWPTVRHTFTHFHLDIQPVLAQVCGRGGTLMEGGNHVWYNTAQPDPLGLAAPVTRLLQSLQQESEGVTA